MSTKPRFIEGGGICIRADGVVHVAKSDRIRRWRQSQYRLDVAYNDNKRSVSWNWQSKDSRDALYNALVEELRSAFSEVEPEE